VSHLVIQIVRILVHFIWDYRRKCPISSEDGNQEKNLLAILLQNFAKDIRALNDDVRALRTSHLQKARVEENHILAIALVRRYSSWLCGIWDVWAQLGVEPGDVGYIKRGSDRLRPTFERLFNIMDKVQDNPLLHTMVEIQYYPPAAGVWTSDTAGPGLVW
jgi:hypothetical protein